MAKNYTISFFIMVLLVFFLSRSVYAEELPTLHFATSKVATEHFDETALEEALNDYIAPKIHARIQLEFIELETYSQTIDKYLELGTMPDLFFAHTYSQIQELYQKQALLPLEDLLEEKGINILPLLSKEQISTHTINGHMYSIPTLRDATTTLCLEYREDIAEKYGLDMESVHSVSDLTSVFSQLYAQNKEIIPLSSVLFNEWDVLTDNLGVLMDPGESSKVENLYETAVYQNFAHLLNQWNHNGYMANSDYNLQTTNSFVRTPEYFSKICNYWPGLSYVDSADAEEPVKCVLLSPSYRTTRDVEYCVFGVSADTHYPEEAIAFLNLLYTDSYVVNLLTYGIEGKHYQFVDRENKIIEYPNGITAKNSDYSQFRGYQNGNSFLCYLWKGYPLDIWQKTIDFNNAAIPSVAFGFQYDSSRVSAEVSACKSITSKYVPLLEKGIGNEKQLLEQLNQELYSAGLQKIMDEKQQQLDEWLKEQRDENKHN